METRRPTKRELNQRRIMHASRALGGAAVAATAVFASLAAHETAQANADTAANAATSSSSESSGIQTLTPAASAPQETFDAPVASSGGS
jgi:uncharacterized membrane protein (DUF4010 family)